MDQLSWIDHFAQKDNRDDLFRLRLLPIFKVTCDDDNVDNLFCGIFTGTTFLGSSGIFQAASGDDNVDNVVFCIGHLHLDSIDPWLVFALGERPSKVKSSPNTRTPCFNFLFYICCLVIKVWHMQALSSITKFVQYVTSCCVA